MSFNVSNICSLDELLLSCAKNWVAGRGHA